MTARSLPPDNLLKPKSDPCIAGEPFDLFDFIEANPKFENVKLILIYYCFDLLRALKLLLFAVSLTAGIIISDNRNQIIRIR